MKSQSKNPLYKEWILNGRDDRIRTCDPLVPSEVRYQAALHPEKAIQLSLNSLIFDPRDLRTSIIFYLVLYFVVYRLNGVLATSRKTIQLSAQPMYQ